MPFEDCNAFKRASPKSWHRMPSGGSTAGAWAAGSAVKLTRATPGGPVNQTDNTSSLDSRGTGKACGKLPVKDESAEEIFPSDTEASAIS